MKLNLMILAIFACMAVQSCKEKPAQPPAESITTDSTNTTDKETSYLPVADLILEDIRRVDSFAAGILYKREGPVNDSSFIKLPKFNEMAKQFMLPELDSANFPKLFDSESFLDQTTEMINFIYPAKDSTISLRKVVVYVKPSQAHDKVSRIYMEKESRYGNEFIQEKMTWVIGKYFYILTIRHPDNGEPVSGIQKVIWDPQSYANQ